MALITTLYEYADHLLHISWETLKNIIAHFAKLTPELQKHHIFNLRWAIYYINFLSVANLY